MQRGKGGMAGAASQGDTSGVGHPPPWARADLNHALFFGSCLVANARRPVRAPLKWTLLVHAIAPAVIAFREDRRN